MDKVKVFKENIEIGGLQIPTDFNCVDGNFIESFSTLDYFERVNSICKLLIGEFDNDLLPNLKNVEFPASIMNIDDNLAVVELFDGDNANYLDYVAKNDKYKIPSIISLILSVYVDLTESNLIKLGDKINVAVPSNDGLFVISTYIAMKMGVPINAVIVGGKNVKNYENNGLFTYSVSENDCFDYLYDFFYDYDYIVDTFSANAIVANETYKEENEELFTVIFAFLSPYFDARKLIKIISGKNELDVKKAIKKLYEETALEVPNNIENGSTLPFFNFDFTTQFENLVKFL